MKFCKRYEEYMRGRREKELPALGLKQLKKILKRCGREFQSQHQKQDDGGGSKFAGNCAGIMSKYIYIYISDIMSRLKFSFFWDFRLSARERSDLFLFQLMKSFESVQITVVTILHQFAFDSVNDSIEASVSL